MVKLYCRKDLFDSLHEAQMGFLAEENQYLEIHGENYRVYDVTDAGEQGYCLHMFKLGDNNESI